MEDAVAPFVVAVETRVSERVRAAGLNVSSSADIVMRVAHAPMMGKRKLRIDGFDVTVGSQMLSHGCDSCQSATSGGSERYAECAEGYEQMHMQSGRLGISPCRTAAHLNRRQHHIPRTAATTHSRLYSPNPRQPCCWPALSLGGSVFDIHLLSLGHHGTDSRALLLTRVRCDETM